VSDPGFGRLPIAGERNLRDHDDRVYSCTSIFTFLVAVQILQRSIQPVRSKQGTTDPVRQLHFSALDRGAAHAAHYWNRSKGAKQMFASFEELTRFGESARKVLLKSIARWTAATAIAALWIQAFLNAFLPAE
jgi:hypothetical protein